MTKIVILGTGGRLGAALAREFKEFDITGFNREQLDLSDLDGFVEAVFETAERFPIQFALRK